LVFKILIQQLIEATLRTSIRSAFIALSKKKK